MIELSSLQAKLAENYPLPKEFSSLMRCRQPTETHTMVCEDCGHFHVFEYNCNRRFCPACSFKISMERRKVLEACKHLLKQPKHIVLTARNQESLRHMFAVVLTGVRKLLRQKILATSKGGWISFETTNEGRGWHVHAHLLLDVRWVPADQLAIAWGKCVGQDFAIVKVKDARDTAYLAEVTKYTVKPSVFISWTQPQRAEFVQAIKGRRLFVAVGHMKEATANVRANIKAGRAGRGCCAHPQLTSVRQFGR